MRIAILGVAIVASACLPQVVIECEDGLVCSTSRVCDEKRHQCVSVDQVRACTGFADGAVCTSATGTGVCDAGVCVEARCGDGYVTGVEACDDGNTTDTDGCSADCSSSERCGNGVVDPELGETCDCGAEELAPECVSLNSDTPGTVCKANCVLQCGDGVVNAVEDCDTVPTPGGCVGFGFDRGPLSCSSCTNEISECGNFGLQRVGGPGLPGPAWGHWVAPTGETFLAGGTFLAGQIGNAWTIDQSVSFLESWQAVAGVDASFVLAVGSHSSLEGSASIMMRRWDGVGWQDFANLPPTPGRFFMPADLWVESQTDIVIVGQIRSFSPPFDIELGLMSWNGSTWTRDLSMLGALFAITEIGGGDLVAVGNDGVVALRRSGVWSIEMAPGAPDLRAVWAGGGVVIAAGVDGAIVRYSIADDTWTTDAPPATTSFLAIGGRSPTDLYASSVTPTGATTFIDQLWHYDGQVWFPLEVDASVGRVTTLLLDPHGEIVGEGANFTTYRFEPGGWGAQPLPAPIFGPVAPVITGAGSTVYASANIAMYRVRAGALESLAIGTASAMHALAEDDLYLATFNGGSSLLERYDGQNKAPLVQRCPVAVCTDRPTIIGLWAQAPGHVHFASETKLYERTPDEVRTEVTPALDASDRFVAMSGLGSSVFALTRNGWVWSNGTGSWQPMTRLALTGVSLWVAPTGEIFVGGDDGAIWHYDLTQWVPLPTDTHERINSIHGSSAEDVFATTQTTVQYFDGTRWSPVRCNPDGVGVVWTTAVDAFFVGNNGLRRLERPIAW